MSFALFTGCLGVGISKLIFLILGMYLLVGCGESKDSVDKSSFDKLLVNEGNTGDVHPMSGKWLLRDIEPQSSYALGQPGSQGYSIERAEFGECDPMAFDVILENLSHSLYETGLSLSARSYKCELLKPVDKLSLNYSSLSLFVDLGSLVSEDNHYVNQDALGFVQEDGLSIVRIAQPQGNIHCKYSFLMQPRGEDSFYFQESQSCVEKDSSGVTLSASTNLIRGIADKL